MHLEPEDRVILAAAKAAPDAQPLTPKQFKAMKKLDSEEQALLKDFESGKLKRIANAKSKLKQHRQYAAAARAELLQGITRGEQAIDAGHVLSHASAKKRMTRWVK